MNVLGAPALLARSVNIVLDFDDTLVNTYGVRAITLERTARRFGYVIDHDRLRRVWGSPFPELIRLTVPFVDFDEFFAAYKQEMAKDAPVELPGSSALLTYCQEHGKRVVIHSSSRTELIEQDILYLDWGTRIDAVFGVDRTGYAKPDPRSLQHVINWLHAQDSLGCVYIGDSPADSIVALACGVPFIAVLSGLTKNPALYADGSYIVTSLVELLEVV